jgi:hypothetical protein
MALWGISPFKGCAHLLAVRGFYSDSPPSDRVLRRSPGCFQMFSEKTFSYMWKTVEDLREKYDGASDPNLRLRRWYDEKIGAFPCRSFNLGKQVTTYPHRDEKNLAQGWCSITALGRFNADLGGHLVLWDFGLVIRFPPGSTILIPSALFVHSNTSIQPDETRNSIVQYAAGGLFRWVERGFMSEKDWFSQATKKDLLEDKGKQGCRWAEAAEMFTKVDDLM